MSIVCGAIVMIRPAPTWLRSDRNACAMAVALSPFSRSMSTPSKPKDRIRPATLLAKLAAEPGSPTETRPVSPPTERMTFLPRPCSVWTSARKSVSLYPPSLLDRPESTANVTPPGVPVASAKATATRSYSVGTSRSRRAAAGFVKSCQYPVRKCFGSDPIGQPEVATGTPAVCGDSPAPLTAVTVYVCDEHAPSPLIVVEVPAGEETTVLPSYTR